MHMELGEEDTKQASDRHGRLVEGGGGSLALPRIEQHNILPNVLPRQDATSQAVNFIT
jgi:hypothetical protein